MKAGELSMVQYCVEHGGFRVLPLDTCEALARQMYLEASDGCTGAGEVLHWVVVGHAKSESDAFVMLKEMRRMVKGGADSGQRTADSGQRTADSDGAGGTPAVRPGDGVGETPAVRGGAGGLPQTGSPHYTGGDDE